MISKLGFIGNSTGHLFRFNDKLFGDQSWYPVINIRKNFGKNYTLKFPIFFFFLIIFKFLFKYFCFNRIEKWLNKVFRIISFLFSSFLLLDKPINGLNLESKLEYVSNIFFFFFYFSPSLKISMQTYIFMYVHDPI